MAVWLALVVLAAVFNDFFYGFQDTTTGFVPENFSNSIMRERPLRVDFTATGQLRHIDIRFVANDERAYLHGLFFYLYREDGTLLHTEELRPGEEDAGAVHEIDVGGLVDKGERAYFELHSDVAEEEEAYRIAMGQAVRTDVTAWYYAGQPEVDVPEVGLVYYRFARTYFALYAVCMLAITMVFIMAPLRRLWVRRGARAGVALLCPLMVVYATELLASGNLEQIAPVPFLANAALAGCVYLLLFALIGRFGVAVAAGTSLLLTGALTNHYILEFRGMVITPTDVYGLATAAGVADGYTLSFSRPVLLCLAFWLAMLCLGFWADFRVKGVKRRGAVLACSAVCIGGLGIFAANEAAHQPFGIYIDRFRQTQASRSNGFYMNFAINLRDLVKLKPKGYTVEGLQRGDVARAEALAAQADGAAPNIIFIMNESLADLSIAGDPLYSEDPLSFIRSLAEHEAGYFGYAVVPTFGAGTSMSEFESLTGFTQGFENVSFAPYYQYAKRELPSIARQLAELGYSAAAMHPEQSRNWGRAEAWPRLGFEETLFIEDFDDYQDQLVRSMVGDWATYQKAFELIEAAQSPQFVFDVTMQNHGGYSVGWYENRIEVYGPGEEFASEEQYFTLIKESDEGFRKLVELLAGSEEPTLVVMFGDHWPALSAEYWESFIGILPEALEGPDMLLAYTTPLVVWSNYGADLSLLEELGGRVSVNYLPALIKALAGLPLTEYDSFLLALAQDWPVVSTHGIVDSEGAYYSPEGYAALDEALRLYGYIVYNGMLEGGAGAEGFYSYSVP